MKQIDVIRISIQLLETNGPHAILALPAKKTKLAAVLSDREYVQQIPVDDLERARRLKKIDMQIAELEQSIEKSENTINGFHTRLPQLRKMLQNLEAIERREHIKLAP